MEKRLYFYLCTLLLLSNIYAEQQADATQKEQTKVQPSAAETADAIAPLSMSIGASGEYLMGPPDQKSLERHISTMVDHYTGTAKVLIPLYTIESYGVKMPITLNYRASGVKVDDITTWVGDNWKLNAGGKITRMINSQPDEGGYFPTGGALADRTDWNNSNFDSHYNNRFDGEPDLYIFELPTGQSGMFVIDYHKNIATIPYQDVKIEWMNNTDYPNSYFIITDQNGIKYRFGASDTYKEMTTNDSYKYKKTFVSSWLLEDMVANGQTIASFTYRSTFNTTTTYKNTFFRFRHYESNPKKQNESSTTSIDHTTRSTPKVLQAISWELGNLTFISEDVSQGFTKLNEIRINDDQHKRIKSICFNVKTTYINSSNNVERSQLDGIYEDSGEQSMPILSFEYFPTDKRPRNHNSYDYWGYNNGQTSYLEYPSYRALGTIISGANRQPNLDYAKLGTLKKISYPTGGFIEFEYDLHKGHSLAYTNSETTVGGLRIRKISECLNESSMPKIISYQYDKSNELSGGELYTDYMPYARSRHGIEQNGVVKVILGITAKADASFCDISGIHIAYPSVKEILPNGSYNIYNFHSFSDCGDIEGQCQPITDWGKGGLINDPDYRVPNTSMIGSRGLLKQLDKYNNSNVLVYSEKYNYNFSVPPKLTIKSSPIYYLYEEMNVSPLGDLRTRVMGHYNWISQKVPLISKVIESGIYNQRSITTYTYLSGANDDLIPRVITTTDQAGNELKTIFKYPQDYVYTRSGPTEYDGIKALKLEHLLTNPIETVNYKNDKVISCNVNVYYDNADQYRLKETRTLSLKSPINYSAIEDGKYYNFSSPHWSTDHDQILEYNNKGLPTFVKRALGGKGTHIIYGHNDLLPIAKVHNIAGASAFHTSFEDDSATIYSPTAKTGNKILSPNVSYSITMLHAGNYNITYWRRAAVAGVWEQFTSSFTGTKYTIHVPYYVDEVRIMPAGATMETYTYAIGIGKTSETDVNGNTITYKYNSLGLLSSILDNDGTIVKVISY